MYDCDLYDYSELLYAAYVQNYHPGWAWHQYVEFNGDKPQHQWALHACLGENPSTAEIKDFIDYLIGHYYREHDAKQKIWGRLHLELGNKYKKSQYLTRQAIYKYIDRES